MFDLSYLFIFAAAAALVFGLASLFEKLPQTVSVRRGSTGWFGTSITSRFQSNEKTRLELLQAGFEGIDAAQTYAATRIMLMVILPLAVLAVLPLAKPDVSTAVTILIAISAGMLGFIAPSRYISQRRTKRQQAIREGLPDVLDLLLVSTEAGLGLDTAVLRVGEETASIHPVLSRQLLQVSSELRAGRPRAVAFRALGDRCGIDETTSMVNLLVQSDTLGTSMAATLRAFADDMRAHRLLKAEEIGQKMGVKLSLILVMCFLPALMTAILSPIVSNVINNGGHIVR
jgi:tight adherence protein C